MELGPTSADGGHFHIAYDRGVVEQWVGPAGHEGKGVRRALLRVIEAAATRQDHSTLVGRAPAGRTLRLKKEFQTSTSEICTVAQPSRPQRHVPAAVHRAPGRVRRHERPDRLRRQARVHDQGRRQQRVLVDHHAVDAAVRFKAGRRESWKLTCEDDAGTVYESRDVTIWRGEVQSLEMRPSGRFSPRGAPGLANRSICSPGAFAYLPCRESRRGTEADAPSFETTKATSS